MSKEEREKTKSVDGEYPVNECEWKAYKHLEEYTQGLKEKKIIGSLCTSCGTVYVPPRYICGKCFRRIGDRVRVSDKGTVVGYMIGEPMEKGQEIMGMDVVEMGIVEKGERIITATVRWDGADSVADYPLEDVEPEDVRTGMRVRAVWKDNPQGNLGDLDHVEPMKVK